MILPESHVPLPGEKGGYLALVASILIDGGLTYMLYQGLNALFGQKRDEVQASRLSQGYHQVRQDADEQKSNFISDIGRSDGEEESQSRSRSR